VFTLLTFISPVPTGSIVDPTPLGAAVSAKSVKRSAPAPLRAFFPSGDAVVMRGLNQPTIHNARSLAIWVNLFVTRPISKASTLLMPLLPTRMVPKLPCRARSMTAPARLVAPVMTWVEIFSPGIPALINLVLAA